MISWAANDRQVFLIIGGAVSFAILATGLAVAARALGSPSPLLGALPLIGAGMGAVLGWLASGDPLP